MVAAGDIAQNYVPPWYRLEHPCDPFKQSMERLLVHRLCFCHPRLPATQGTNVVLFRRTPTRICHFLPTDLTLSCLLSTMSRQICRALRIWGLVTSRRKALLETQAACERNIPDTHKKKQQGCMSHIGVSISQSLRVRICIGCLLYTSPSPRDRG